jgi:hypothetical protein
MRPGRAIVAGPFLPLGHADAPVCYQHSRK